MRYINLWLIDWLIAESSFSSLATYHCWVLKNNGPCAGCGLGDWLWLKLLRSRAHLHIHSVSVLPGTRSHFWRPLWCGNWHVEPRMYSLGTSNRSTTVFRRRRSRSDCLHHWDIRYTSFKSRRCWEEVVKLYCSEWISTVCGLMPFGIA